MKFILNWFKKKRQSPGEFIFNKSLTDSEFNAMFSRMQQRYIVLLIEEYLKS